MAYRAIFGFRIAIPTHSLVLDNLGLIVDLSEPRTAEEQFQLLGLTLKNFGMGIKKEIEPTMDKIALTLESIWVPKEVSDRIWDELRLSESHELDIIGPAKESDFDEP